MKRYYIESLGCAKNQVDSEQLMFLLSGGNWESVDPEDADIIIVNSCGFIESAKQESINTVLAFRKRFPLKKIMLAGCLAVRYAQDLSKLLVEADIIFPSADIQKIVEYLFREGEESKKDPDAACAQSGIELDAVLPTKNSPHPIRSSPQPLLISGERPLLSLPGSAYIKIAEGCNNSCSFCAIPLIRGSLRSRTIPGIQSEFEALLKRGVKEINLIAQDSASYGRDSGESLLAPLLESLLKTSGNFWLRLLYLHPDHFPFDILPLMQKDKRLLPYFDIPFQHASKKILSAMNRRGDNKTYLSLINRIRDAVPGAIVRSTFLTGFPGEDEADFEDLLDFQKNAELDWLGVFCYSREDDTAAYHFKKRPSKKCAALRKAKLEEEQIALTEKRLAGFLGQKLDILVEEEIDDEDGLYLGRAYLNAPEVDGSVLIESEKKLIPGAFVNGSVKGLAGFDLQALL